MPTNKKRLIIAILLLLCAILPGTHTQDDNSQFSNTEEDYFLEEEREFEADIHVRRFADYVKSNDLVSLVYPDFRRGRSVAYRVSNDAYWASEQSAEEQAAIDCGNLIPESYDFYRCDYISKAALVRRRFAMASRIENDCALHEHDIRITNFSTNAVLKAWGVNCDCQEGFLSDSAQSLADLGIVASAGASANGFKCEANFSFSQNHENPNYAYVLGCNFATGKISLLPLSEGSNNPQLSTNDFVTTESEICKCGALQGRLKILMFSNCASGIDVLKSQTISNDSSTCRLASNQTCKIVLPSLLKFGTCDFSSGKRTDEALFLSYDALNHTSTKSSVTVQTLHPLCNCDKHIFAQKFDMCDYSQKVGLVTTYQGLPSINGSVCEVIETHKWPKKDECDCKTGYRYLAPPLCHIIKNNKTVTHAWTVHDNHKHCVGVPPEQRNEERSEEEEEEHEPAEHPVYDPQFNQKMREEHANLRAKLEELFNEPLHSSCECTKKTLRIPLGCTLSSSFDSRYVMRFLVLTRHRGRFFCTVSKKFEIKPVNSKFCYSRQRS